MLTFDGEALSKAKGQLQSNCPSPEEELICLSKIAAGLPSTEEGSRIRLLVLDIDDLIAQTRWHLGQGLLLMETQPHIFDNPKDLSDQMLYEYGMPANAMLLLRGYIRRADQVIYSDLSEPRRGGTVAGWIFHMMIDSAIYRTIAVLDRLARILWYAAKLPSQHKSGSSVKVYFRSGKIRQIHQVIRNDHSLKLLKIAEGPLLEYVISYRDGLAHDIKVYSQIAGTQPSEEWITPDGKRSIAEHDKWEVDTLFALGNATYHQLLDSLTPAVRICEDRLKVISPARPESRKRG